MYVDRCSKINYSISTRMSHCFSNTIEIAKRYCWIIIFRQSYNKCLWHNSLHKAEKVALHVINVDQLKGVKESIKMFLHNQCYAMQIMYIVDKINDFKFCYNFQTNCRCLKKLIWKHYEWRIIDWSIYSHSRDIEKPWLRARLCNINMIGQ